MKILVDNNKREYIDKDLFDHINTIWLNYDVEIADNSGLYFTKNTTVNRLITDVNTKGIGRVIKPEKAEYVCIKRFEINNFPQYMDISTNTITSDDTKEVVYGIYNNSPEDRLTIKTILDFKLRNQDVKYVNQDYLNVSINNGLVIDETNYMTIKELLNSESRENHIMAITMLANSDVKANLEWIFYICHGAFDAIYSYDKKGIIAGVCKAHNLEIGKINVLDYCIEVTKNKPEICDNLIQIVKDNFNKNINRYFDTLGSKKFKLDDFKISLI